MISTKTIVTIGLFVFISASLLLPTGSGRAMEPLYDTGYRNMVGIIERDLVRGPRLSAGGIEMGITSHHLPTALPLIADFYKMTASSGQKKTIVVIGPDHFEKCSGRISTTSRGYRTPFGVLSVDKPFIDELVRHKIKVEPECFDGEHSIGVQALFIKKMFKNASIVPILVSSRATSADSYKLARLLAEKNGIFIIGSIDFSHHYGFKRARLADKATAEAIKSASADTITLRQADSPATIRTLLYITKLRGYALPRIVGQANSYDYCKIPYDTTGYLNVVFAR